jgi:hypothetical protein
MKKEVSAETAERYRAALEQIKTLTNDGPAKVSGNKLVNEFKVPSIFLTVLKERLQNMPITENADSTLQWKDDEPVSESMILDMVTACRDRMALSKKTKTKANKAAATHDVVKPSTAKITKPVKSKADITPAEKVENILTSIEAAIPKLLQLFTAAHLSIYNRVDFDVPVDVIIDGNISLMNVSRVLFKSMDNNIIITTQILSPTLGEEDMQLITTFSIQLEDKALELQSIEEAMRNQVYRIISHHYSI